MTRFMAPRYFEQDQLHAVEATLDRLEIGDEEGRRIFVIALEYELAEYEKNGAGQVVDLPPPSPDAGHDLLKLAESAEAFCLSLRGISIDQRDGILQKLNASDPFAREHGPDYLAALLDHLNRISLACHSAEIDLSLRKDAMTEAQSRFIDVLAEAYWECFETDPAEAACEPFASLLNSISEICSLGIQLDGSRLRPMLQLRKRAGA